MLYFSFSLFSLSRNSIYSIHYTYYSLAISSILSSLFILLFAFLSDLLLFCSLPFNSKYSSVWLLLSFILRLDFILPFFIIFLLGSWLLNSLPLILLFFSMSLLFSFRTAIIIYSSFFLTLFLFMWINDYILECVFCFSRTECFSLVYGIKLFILSELMLFFCVFWTQLNFRFCLNVFSLFNSLPLLSSYCFAIPYSNVIILLFSSLPCQACIVFYKLGFLFSAMEQLGQCISCGMVFLVLQLKEFFYSFHSISDCLIGSIFYFTTSLHGLHVLLGLSYFILILFLFLASLLINPPSLVNCILFVLLIPRCVNFWFYYIYFKRFNFCFIYVIYFIPFSKSIWYYFILFIPFLFNLFYLIVLFYSRCLLFNVLNGYYIRFINLLYLIVYFLCFIDLVLFNCSFYLALLLISSFNLVLLFISFNSFYFFLYCIFKLGAFIMNRQWSWFQRIIFFFNSLLFSSIYLALLFISSIYCVALIGSFFFAFNCFYLNVLSFYLIALLLLIELFLLFALLIAFLLICSFYSFFFKYVFNLPYLFCFSLILAFNLVLFILISSFICSFNLISSILIIFEPLLVWAMAKNMVIECFAFISILFQLHSLVLLIALLISSILFFALYILVFILVYLILFDSILGCVVLISSFSFRFSLSLFSFSFFISVIKAIDFWVIVFFINLFSFYSTPFRIGSLSAPYFKWLLYLFLICSFNSICSFKSSSIISSIWLILLLEPWILFLSLFILIAFILFSLIAFIIFVYLVRLIAFFSNKGMIIIINCFLISLIGFDTCIAIAAVYGFVIILFLLFMEPFKAIIIKYSLVIIIFFDSLLEPLFAIAAVYSIYFIYSFCYWVVYYYLVLFNSSSIIPCSSYCFFVFFKSAFKCFVIFNSSISFNVLFLTLFILLEPLFAIAAVYSINLIRTAFRFNCSLYLCYILFFLLLSGLFNSFCYWVVYLVYLVEFCLFCIAAVYSINIFFLITLFFFFDLVLLFILFNPLCSVICFILFVRASLLQQSILMISFYLLLLFVLDYLVFNLFSSLCYLYCFFSLLFICSILINGYYICFILVEFSDSLMISSLYWHFVDVIWIIVFFLYFY